MQKRFIVVKTNKGNAKLYTGTPKSDVPETYKENGLLSHNIGNNYNPSLLRLYKARDNSLRYGIYRDGCFYAYYGRFEFIK